MNKKNNISVKMPFYYKINYYLCQFDKLKL